MNNAECQGGKKRNKTQLLFLYCVMWSIYHCRGEKKVRTQIQNSAEQIKELQWRSKAVEDAVRRWICSVQKRCNSCKSLFLLNLLTVQSITLAKSVLSSSKTCVCSSLLLSVLIYVIYDFCIIIVSDNWVDFVWLGF